MFTGPDPGMQAFVQLVLALGACCTLVGVITAVLGAPASSQSARWFASLASAADEAPTVVGLACAGLVFQGVDLRPGHDVLTTWPALLPAIGTVFAAAGFLSGFIRDARPLPIAMRIGGPTVLVSLIVGAPVAALWWLGWNVNPDPYAFRNASPPVVAFLVQLASFPLLAIVGSAVAVVGGRRARQLLGLPTVRACAAEDDEE